jgi:hypothetical protein
MSGGGVVVAPCDRRWSSQTRASRSASKLAVDNTGANPSRQTILQLSIVLSLIRFRIRANPVFSLKTPHFLILFYTINVNISIVNGLFPIFSTYFADNVFIWGNMCNKYILLDISIDMK